MDVTLHIAKAHINVTLDDMTVPTYSAPRECSALQSSPSLLAHQGCPDARLRGSSCHVRSGFHISVVCGDRRRRYMDSHISVTV